MLLLATALLAPSAAAQTVELPWFMSDQASETPGAELLMPASPDAATATHLFSPLVGDTVAALGPTSYDWASDIEFPADLEIVGDSTVTLTFNVGIDVAATTTVILSTVADGVVTELARNTDSGLAEIPGHTETITLPTDGLALPEGHRLLLTVSVTGAAVAVSLEYNSAASASGITTMSVQILDTDGDGFGDSAERAAGTDPNDAISYPGNPDNDGDGLLDVWEMLHFGDLNMTGTDDPDGDGLDNEAEETGGTDPNLADTDGDGLTDGQERADGTDPLDGSSPGTDTASADDSTESSDIPEVAAGAFLLSLSLGAIGLALLGRFPA